MFRLKEIITVEPYYSYKNLLLSCYVGTRDEPSYVVALDEYGRVKKMERLRYMKLYIPKDKPGDEFSRDIKQDRYDDIFFV